MYYGLLVQKHIKPNISYNQLASPVSHVFHVDKKQTGLIPIKDKANNPLAISSNI